MWDRILFPIRRRTPELGRLLGSWKLSVVLMVVAALYYGFLAIWATSSPPHVVQRIASLAPFWVVYLLLLTNTGVCLWRRFPALRRDLRAEPAAVKTPPAQVLPTAAGMTPDQAEAMMRRLGFRTTRTHDRALWGLRRRWASLGTYLFHGSFFLLLAAAALTMALRHDERAVVAVGEEFVGAPEQSRSVSQPALIGLRPPPPGFTVESIVPEFWGDALLFTQLEARLVLADGGPAVTRINRPLWTGWWTFLRLSGFGYAPRYELADRHGRVLESAFVKVNVFPPGQRDSFTLEQYPHRVSLEVLPDAVEVEGEVRNRSLNLVEPAALVRVTRGRVELGEAAIFPGDGLEFEGMRLSFPEIRYWGEFSIVHDPGIPVLFLAFAIAMVGLAFKVRGGRGEALWTPGAEGAAGRLELWGPPAHLPDPPGPVGEAP